MANTLDWKNSEDRRDLVHLVVQALVEGRLVVLPTETSYHIVASGLRGEAFDALSAYVAKGKVVDPTLLIRSAEELRDYVPDLSHVAQRMSSRGWPGPLVLQLPVSQENSLHQRLPDSLSKQISGQGSARYRVVAHEVISQIMRLMPGPLIGAPLFRHENGKNVAVTNAADARTSLGDDAIAILDDGETHHSGFATTVAVDGHRCRITRLGVLDGENLYRLAQFVVLTVCTGNTCRSPMAETLLRAKLFQRMPKPSPDAPDRYYIGSAGVNAFPGGPASPEAITVMRERGLSLVDHQSRALTERALRIADLILTMTKSHRLAILEKMPDISEKVFLISGANDDLSDPFGGSTAIYAACADQIDRFLDNWLNQFEENWFPEWADI